VSVEASTPAARWGFWGGLVVALAVGCASPWLGPALGLEPAAGRMLAVTLWVGIWWVTEAFPIGATSLLPLAAFPVFGIASAAETSPSYAAPVVMLLLGGFLLALTVERSGAHRRLALLVLLTLGTSPRRLVLGFAVAAGLLSMWISNTATTLIMMPVALAVADRAAPADADRAPEQAGAARRFGLAVLLGTAYGASVGGMGTPVGTPPNLIAMAALARTFPQGPEVTFLTWIGVAGPGIVAVIPVTWWMLTRVYPKVPVGLELGARPVLEAELRQLGPWRTAEVRSLGVFGVAALLWITRSDLALGGGVEVAGWASRLGLEGTHDSTVAMAAALLAFAMPSGESDGSRLLPWSTAVRVPWGLVLLFGGGIALAVGFERTGLSQALGEGLAQLGQASWPLFVAAVCFGCTFGTEIISNTALANIAMPIFAATAQTLGQDPRALLVPAAMACSCAFMMPTATGPNAIVFGSGRLRIVEMIRAGFFVNLAAWVLIVAFALLSYR
jgi:sodium-dependent dicarboxylate transporter 2/3/5